MWRNSRRIAALLAAAVSIPAAVAQAHHFFATEYEAEATVTIQGVVAEVRYRNPHVQLLVAVRGEGGAEELWAANTVSPRSLPRRGWERDTISAGDALTLHGNLGRDGSRRLWIQTLTLIDAEPIYPVGRVP